MSHFGTERKQIRTGDPRQIFKPADLQPGSHIAVIKIFRGTTPQDRFRQALHGLIGATWSSDYSKGRLDLAREGWNHQRPEAAVFSMRGLVRWTEATEAGIDILAAPEEPLRILSATKPEDLPPLSSPERQVMDFSELGLTAIQQIATIDNPQPEILDVGRWRPVATLLLDSA